MTDHGQYNFEAECREARRLIVSTIHETGGGHYGGSLSVVEILGTLFAGFLRRSVKNRIGDKLILSKGHAAPALYAMLSIFRGLPESHLPSYGKAGSPLQGHPDMTVEPLVDFSTGSLGQGLSIGLGMSLILRQAGGRVWVVVGDGECQEGQVWEAARLASKLGAANLTLIVDNNGYQEWAGGELFPHSPPVDCLREKWQAFGWNVEVCDGHDFHALRWALRMVSGNDDKPGAVIAMTQKGRGARLIAADPYRFHCGSLSPEEYSRVMEEIGE